MTPMHPDAPRCLTPMLAQIFGNERLQALRRKILSAKSASSAEKSSLSWFSFADAVDGGRSDLRLRTERRPAIRGIAIPIPLDSLRSG